MRLLRNLQFVGYSFQGEPSTSYRDISFSLAIAQGKSDSSLPYVDIANPWNKKELK
jgi:hypothetical protein